MRMRDATAIFLLGSTFQEISLYFGWDTGVEPVSDVIATAITLALMFGACAIYDRYMVVRRNAIQ